MALALDRHGGATLESQSLYNLAIEKINRNKFREALDHLIDALRIAPKNPLYLSYFGVCIAQVQGDFDRALRHCKQALDVLPLDPVLNVNLGKVYRLRGDNFNAHRIFVTAFQINKNHPSPAAELTRMGIRRPPVIPFLPRSNWANRHLGRLRAHFERRVLGRRAS